jgi:secondary thiamine-phosphate synthase enzyme
MDRDLTVVTREHACLVDITGEIDRVLRAFGLEEGSVLVWVPHTTAGVTVNENADPSVAADILAALDRIAPWEGNYRHAEGNAAAHLKASLMGASVTIPVRRGRLALGSWQGVFLAEFDGPRTRTVVVSGRKV